MIGMIDEWSLLRLSPLMDAVREAGMKACRNGNCPMVQRFPLGSFNFEFRTVVQKNAVLSLEDAKLDHATTAWLLANQLRQKPQWFGKFMQVQSQSTKYGTCYGTCPFFDFAVQDARIFHFPDAYGLTDEGREPWAKYIDGLIEEIDQAAGLSWCLNILHDFWWTFPTFSLFFMVVHMLLMCFLYFSAGLPIWW